MAKPPSLDADEPAPDAPDKPPDWRAVRKLARTFSLDAIQSLAGMMVHSQSDPARVTAAVALLRFGWGRRATTGDEKQDAQANVIDFLTARVPQPDRTVAGESRDVLPGGATGDAGAVAEPGASPDRDE